MPMTDKQRLGFMRWLSTAELETRLDWLWDNLSGAQQNGLVNRVKSDLQNDVNLTASGVAARNSELIDAL